MDEEQGKELVALCRAYTEWDYYWYKSYPDELHCELRLDSGGTRSPKDRSRYAPHKILEGGNRRKARKIRREIADRQEWLDRYEAYEERYCSAVDAGA